MVADAGNAVTCRAAMCALALMAPEIEAQRTWIDPTPDNAIGVTVGTAMFRDNITTSPTVTAALRGRIAVANDLVLTAELPMGRATQASGLSGTAFGLPWLGFELRATPWATFEFGGRTNLGSPTSQRELLPYAYGPSLDFDRQEAWAPGASAVRAVVHLGSQPQAGHFIAMRAGVVGVNASALNGDGRLFIVAHQWQSGLL
ncbi:MAG TPA: hypothetical protein PLL69_04705, partial [Gemmatimonadales bacterium]|nr:hypothetical protein [Gemmatimonadales bacterium]